VLIILFITDKVKKSLLTQTVITANFSYEFRPFYIPSLKKTKQPTVNGLAKNAKGNLNG